jgi:hypothetical protein
MAAAETEYIRSAFVVREWPVSDLEVKKHKMENGQGVNGNQMIEHFGRNSLELRKKGVLPDK